LPLQKIDPRKFKEIVDSFGTNKTRASSNQHTATKIIDENKEKNPAFYRSLKLRIEEIIEDLRNKNYQDAEKFKKLYEAWDELLSEDEKSKLLGFEEIVQFSVFNSLEGHFGAEKSKGLTLKIHPEVTKLKVVDWEKPEKENIQKEMRNKVKDILAETELEEEKRKELAKEIINVYMVRENE